MPWSIDIWTSFDQSPTSLLLTKTNLVALSSSLPRRISTFCLPSFALKEQLALARSRAMPLCPPSSTGGVQFPTMGVCWRWKLNLLTSCGWLR